MKFVLNNPTEEQLAEIKKLGLPIVYLSGNKVEFEVPEISEEDLTPGELVDLDLPSGTLWASCNIGANKPCDYGLLFQFGRVDGYAYGDNNHHFLSEYDYVTTSGKTYNAGDVLDPADDAAYQATNGAMRMPIKAEIETLYVNTFHEWVSCTTLGDGHESHSVMGILFTSSGNGNKIFIPAAGLFNCINGSFNNAGSNGRVWSSCVDNDEGLNRYNMSFTSNYCDCSNISSPTIACSVRGVCGSVISE